jgi:hypothetical protein
MSFVVDHVRKDQKHDRPLDDDDVITRAKCDHDGCREVRPVRFDPGGELLPPWDWVCTGSLHYCEKHKGDAFDPKTKKRRR